MICIARLKKKLIPVPFVSYSVLGLMMLGNAIARTLASMQSRPISCLCMSLLHKSDLERHGWHHSDVAMQDRFIAIVDQTVKLL